MSYWEGTENLKLIDELDICGCGNPALVYEKVHEMLTATKELRLRDYIGDDAFRLFMAYTLDEKDYLDHGTSIFCAWLTAKGRQLLLAMEEFRKIGYEYPDCDSTEDSFWWREVVEEDTE